MILKIKNGKVVDGTITEANVYVQDGKILAVTPEELSFDEEFDAAGRYISAGFVDIHSHGGGSYDFMDGDVECIVQGAKMHLTHGTTSLYPTTVCASKAGLKKAVNCIKDAMWFPNVRGAHLEGSYFSVEQCGAQNTDYIRDIDFEEAEDLIATGVVKRWDFAPERAHSPEFTDLLVKNGVVPAIAHSNAILEDVEKVFEKGCKLVTHLYSATSTITRVLGYRRLGVVESTFLLDDMNAEIIADGSHLPPRLIEMILKIKGVEKICLVTDSMRAAGMPDGEYIIGSKDEGLPCIKEQGVAKLLDRSAFAGSVATTDILVRTIYKKVGYPLVDAIRMMTENPARIMGLTQKGHVQEGFDADLVIFDDDITVGDVMIEGSWMVSGGEYVGPAV